MENNDAKPRQVAGKGPGEALERENELLRREKEALSQQVKRLIKAEGKLYAFQQDLDAQLKEYKELYELNRRLNGTFNIDSIFQETVSYVVQQLEFERAVLLRNDETGRYRVWAQDGYYEAAEKGIVAAVTLERDDPCLRPVTSQGREYLVCRADSREEELTVLREKLGMDEYFVYPLRCYALPDALLVVGNSADNAGFHRRVDSSGSLLSMGNLVGLVSSLIENRNSFEKMEKARLQERIAEAKYRSIFENAVEGIFQRTPDGKYLDANPSMARMLGYDSPRELMAEVTDVGQQLYVEAQHHAELVRLLDEHDEVEGFEARMYRKDRSVIWISVSGRTVRDGAGRVLFYEGMVEDITERKMAEEALRRNEDYLKNVVDNIPVMVFAKDAATLRYVTLNKAGEDLLELPREELLGKRDCDILPGEQAESFMQKDRLTLERGVLVESLEEAFKTSSGRELILHTKKIPLFDDQGEARYLLGIAEDITARKHLEEQLLQSQKMEAIGQLAGGVAHDFNNILMVIKGLSAMLKRDDTMTELQKEMVQDILDSADKAAQLTSSLLTFSRKQVIRMLPVDLNGIVLHVQKFLTWIVGHDVRLKLVNSDSRMVVNVDAGQIEQGLMNLATNARDAMPAGGVLTIETYRQVIDELFVDVNKFGASGRYAVISVSDTGIGMDDKTKTRIFEPFFTTKEPGKGTGLGMSIVYGIIKQHNGFIHVYSEPQLGTTFRIYLPLVGTDLSDEETRGDAGSPARGTETVLVVEDDPVLRGLLEGILVGYGYRVLLAEDGQDAVAKFRDAPVKVDLVLMDMVMPRLSGKDACAAIRKIDPGVRVAYVSGYSADSIRSREVIEEETVLIMKPIQPMELLRKVREILDR